MLFFGICKGLGKKNAFGGEKSAFQGVFGPKMHFPCLAELSNHFAVTANAKKRRIFFIWVLN